MAKLSDADRQSLSGTTADFQSKAGYQKIQQTRPQTLGYGLTDSPAGQLAWNAELWTGWGDYADYLDVDTYLTHVSIYWFTRTGVSSARHYYEDARSGAGYRDAPNKVPTAVAVFPQDFRTGRRTRETVTVSGGHRDRAHLPPVTKLGDPSQAGSDRAG